ncbi:MAG: GTPase Era [Cellvibrionaceae bacterium]|nr:GTPase Era [Cellvibrionaceae bacterium]
MIKQRCGYVSIVGRPNVGKSTLLNHLLQQKLSITSRKPQTTRHNLIGIKTDGETQMVFVDTPGMHRGESKAINRAMNKSASSALRDVDAVIFVVDANRWSEEDEWVANQLVHVASPVLVALNKIDCLEDKNLLLPKLQQLSERFSQSKRSEIVPISALRNDNLQQLEALVAECMPESEHFYPADQVTDRSLRFLASEMIREKLTRQLGAELPYASAVEIEKFEEGEKVCEVYALILVEREGQKRIVIGDKGERLKKIGQEARLDMEKLFDCKVMLSLWVKVKSGWSDDDRALRSLGYIDQA